LGVLEPHDHSQILFNSPISQPQLKVTQHNRKPGGRLVQWP
jgi:hypothetical protein